MAKNYYIGIDLGGTKMLGALMNKTFKVVAAKKNKVESAKKASAFFDALQEVIDSVLEDSGVSAKKVKAIGIGCAGVIDPKKHEVKLSPNLPFLKDFPMAKKLKKIYKAPVFLENDANAGLYGEQQFGAARGYQYVAGFFLGTGIGGALILDGKIYRGSTGAAGEVGHTVLDPNGPLCGCGKRGCLEAYAGRVAVAADAAILALRRQAPSLYKEAGADLTQIKSRALAESVRDGDAAVRDLLQFKAGILGRVMANTVNLLNPELIVLGGGFMEAAGKYILPEAKKAMNQYGMGPLVKRVKVVPASLGDNAIIKGAAKLAADNA